MASNLQAKGLIKKEPGQSRANATVVARDEQFAGWPSTPPATESSLDDNLKKTDCSDSSTDLFVSCY